MEEKKNDLVLNMLANPGFSLNNFKTVGLTADNTTIADEDKYLNSSKIQNNALFKDNSGNFDKQKFHDFYKTATSAYDFMATDAYNDEFAKKGRTYHRDNIFAPVDQRRKGPDFSWTKISNPDKFTSGIVQLGKITEGDKTWDELAQTQKILANPTEATNPDGTINEDKAIWEDSPNDSWFSNFFETRVAAQWDDDGEYLDPITGEKQYHKKGDLKLNSDGNYYYENLDGRDVYGRRVLNKMNTLTTDGSTWNKYDFFDSDGKDKSVGGSILKNVALAGSMFIPYVGPWVAGLSVATQGAGLLGTLGKMGAAFSNEYLGTDFKDMSTFNNMEGWAKSVNRLEAKSQYALEHPWAMENLLGMVGDVMAQFKEQRWLFQYAPRIFKGKYGIVTDKNYKDTLSEVEQIYADLDKTKMDDLIKSGKDWFSIQKGFKDLATVRSLRAEADLDSYIKGYNKIGEIFAKSYMTGITVGDTFGEAKNQGASDTEALWLTLGYGAGEAAILNTGVGEWLFPELRYNKLHQQAVAKALVPVKEETRKLEEKMTSAALKKGEKELKKDYVKRLFNIGKQTAKDLYTANKNTGDKTIKAAFFNAMGEGSEEVSEELLSDVSKAAFNGVEWLRGKDTRLETFDNGNWENLLNRYSMNFVGGFIGGGVAGLSLDNMRNMKKLDNMEFDPAIQELIYMVRNGLSKDFLKQVDKMELGDKNKSATKFILEGDGYVAAPGTAEDNQDLAAKKMIRAQVKLFEDILSAEGMQISDDSFLAGQTDLLPNLKFALLRNSSTAGRFLLEFNSLGAKIVLANADLLSEKGKPTNGTDKQQAQGDAQIDIQEQTVQQLNATLQDIQARLKDATGEEAETLKTELKDIQTQISKKLDSGDRIARLEKTLKDLRQLKEDLLSGKRTPEFLRDSLYEMTDAINNDFIKPSFIRYAEFKAGKGFADIPDNLKAQLHEEWENWGELDRAEQVHESAQIFANILALSSPMVQQHALNYETLLQNLDVSNLLTILNGYLNIFQELRSRTDPEKWIETAADSLGSLYQGVGLAFSDEAFANRFRELSQLQQDLTSGLVDEERQIQQQIKDVNLNESLSDEDKQSQVATLQAQLKTSQDNYAELIQELHTLKELMMTEQVAKSINSLTQPYIELGFANAEVKRALSQVIDIADLYISGDMRSYKLRKTELLNSGHLNDVQQHELDAINAYLEPKQQQLNELRAQKSQIKALSATPIEQILDQFSVGVNKDLKISKLLEDVNATLEGTSEDISQFSISDDTAKLLGEAILVMDLFASTLQAMKVDNGDLDNIYGYTKTMNEVAHKSGTQGYVDLAEINSDTANILLQDLGIVRKRANFLKNLYSLNSGQKLSEQRRVSLNKDFLFFTRAKALVDGWGDDDDDWKDKNKLKDAINSLETLKQHAGGKTLTLPADVHAKIDEETQRMEDAIFDFFQTNAESLKDPKKLAALLKGNIDLYKVPNDTLKSDSESIDDNSFIWWLATRAAVKSSDFHKEYSSIIDGSIAPIPTQELAAYENFASVVNGDVFYRFYKGMRQAIRDDWNSKTVDERREIIHRQNEHFDNDHKYSSDDLSDDLFKEYPFVNLILPKYSHIVFTEGIPGAGKSTGVYKSTIRMIQNNQSLRDAGILDRAVFVYAAGSDSEEDLQKARENAKKSIVSLGLDPTKTQAMSLEDFMGSITVDRKHCVKNADGSWTVPKDRYKLSYEKEYCSTSELKETSTPPTLVIIDEMTNVNLFDLDDINSHAAKYGYSVLGAGDTDQSGISGEYIIDDDSPYKGSKNALSLYNINFIRTPKLGVSMRTDNSQKTKNLPNAQYWVNNSSDPLKLHYFQDESGLYGDKYYWADTDSDDNGNEFIDSSIDFDNIKGDIDLMVSSLKDGEKIGYVFDSTKSQLYDLLTSDEYKDKVELLPGTTAQGREGQYYIVELTNNRSNYIKDLYTAITRSTQASLIVSNDNNIESIEDKETHKETLGETAIKSFAGVRKTTLDNISGDGKPIVYVPRTKSSRRGGNRRTTSLGPTSGSTLSAPSTSASSTSTPPVTPSSTSEPLDVNRAIQGAQTAGMNIGDSIDYTSAVDGTITNYTLKNIRANEANDAIVVDLDSEDGTTKTIPFEEFMTDNYNKHKEVTPINEIINSSGLTIKVGDYVLIKSSVLNYGKTNGDLVFLVKGIESNGDLTLGYNTNSETVREADDVLDVFQDEEQANSQAYENRVRYQEEENSEEEEIPEQLELDVIPPELYLEVLQQANEPLNPTPEIDAESLKNKVYTFTYSYNTFETGVLEDANGYPIQFGNDVNRHLTRLDSVNGLMNLDKSLGNPIRKVSTYTSIISEIRRVIFNTKDKGLLDTKISDILENHFGISGISTRFGFVSHAELTQNGVSTPDGFSTSTGQFQRFQRHVDEDVLYIHSNGNRAAQTMRKTISIEIAQNGTDILELPILSLANPITMIEQGLVDPQILTIAGLTDILKSEDLDEILKVANQIHTQFNGAYDGFIKLVQVYRGITDDSYRNIRDSNWTPASVLKNRGVQVTGNQRGEDYVEPGFEYDAPYIDITELAKNPDLTISKIMYSQYGTIEKPNGDLVTIDGNEEIIQPGHPFVLISTDPTLTSESLLVKAFVDDLVNESDTPRVKAVYILPPQASIDTYIKSMALLNVGGKANIDDIGNMSTAFKLLQTLFKDENFVNNVNINRSKQWLSGISLILSDCADLDGDELREKLMETRTISGLYIKDQPIHAICKRFLAELGYPDAFAHTGHGYNRVNKGEIGHPNQNNIDLITQCLANVGINGVFFRANKAINGLTWGPFHEISQNSDWSIIGVDGTKHSYQIHGKIDTNEFEGDITPILDEIIKATKGDTMDYIHRHAVSGTVNPGRNKIKSIHQTVKDKTGLEIDSSITSLEDIANYINQNSDYTAFGINGKLHVFSKINNRGPVRFTLDTDGLTEISTLQLDTDGKALFYTHDDSGETYQAIYDDKDHTIEIFKPGKSENSTFIFDETTYKVAQDKIKAANKMLLRPLVNATSSVEFMDALLHKLRGNKDKIKQVLQEIFADDPLMAQNIIDAMLNEERQQQCAMPSIKLNLI